MLTLYTVQFLFTSTERRCKQKHLDTRDGINAIPHVSQFFTKPVLVQNYIDATYVVEATVSFGFGAGAMVSNCVIMALISASNPAKFLVVGVFKIAIQ